jgi:DNA-binding helix-hairpin-helix protein with protein kinase domain
MTEPKAIFPEAGDVVHMVRAGTPIRLEAKVAEGGQGVVFRGLMDTGIQVAIKWYRPGDYADHQRRGIAALTAHARAHPAFAWPIDLVECRRVPGFGYVMQWIPERFGSLIEMLRAPQQPSFRVLAAIGRELADAFAALHASGLCYRDINFGNLLVDPAECEVAIVDNDNVGTEGGDVYIRGTLRFMAPEVIREEAVPSTVTDLHSLAVFLFFLLVHGHPLEGRRVRASYTWHPDAHVSETQLAVRHFGTDALFVFDPADSSNEPEPGDPMLIWWPIYPRFIRELFIRAFGTGLKDASLGGRITEGEWRRALVRLGDCVAACSCAATVFWDPDDPQVQCWNCRAVPPPPPLLEIPGHVIALAEGAVITSNHLSRDRDYRTVMAVVERHPRYPGQVVLRNLSETKWTVEPAGEEPKAVKPQQRLGVRPMKIRFGNVRGSIRMQDAPR